MAEENNSKKDAKRKRQDKMERLSVFMIPSIRSGVFLYYSSYFRDLKKIFNTYIKENDKVLDIGCGNKPYENYIRGLTKNNDKDFYIGCDIIQSSENKVDILCEATSIPELDSTYDVVICTQVIEHVFDHAKVFDEAYRLLKQDGKLIISSNFVWEKHEIPYDFYRFTDHCFEILLTKAGFEIIEGIPNGGKWVVLGHLIIQCFTKKCTSNFPPFKFFQNIWNEGIIIFCNLLFKLLDNCCNNAEKYTLNYIFVGQKKKKKRI